MQRAGRPFALLALAALLSAAAAPKPAAGPPPAARLESEIAAEIERLGIPGAQAAIVLKGTLLLEKAFGVADLENSVPTTPETLFRIASLTKPITAVAAMQLVERGKLDLDAPIQKYVPAFPEKGAPITARQLLCHQSGIRHVADEEWGNTRRYASLADTLDIFKDDALLFTPGTRAEYSTYGFGVLGCAIEGASGEKYLDYLRVNVFKPAGMEAARADDALEIIPHRAAGYRRLGLLGLQNSVLADTSNKVAGGGLLATAADVARFAIALQGDALVNKETRKAMFTVQKTRDGRRTGYGLGFLVGQWRGRREVWHHGGQPRVSTLLYMQPEQKLAIVLLTNLEGQGTALLELARQLSVEVAR